MGTATRVFISATSADLGSVRQLIKEALLSMDCHPVEMKNFPPDYRSVHDVLEEKIAGCQAVLHIVGARYGAEPDPAQLPAHTPRRSYTQLEYDLARKLKKKLYIFLCPNDFPFDESQTEEADKESLQQAHRAALLNDPRLRTKVATREEVAVKVRELQLELQQLRHAVRRSTRHVLIGIAALVILLAGIGYTVARLTGLVGGVHDKVADVDQGVKDIKQTVEEKAGNTIAEIQKLYKDPDVLIGKLKSHIRQRADEQIVELKKDSSNWRKIDEIEKQRDQQLDRVDDLVTTIREGLSGNPDPIFAEAARILAEQGVDEAIAYLQAKQPEIESRVKSTKARRDEAIKVFHASLEPWLLEAQLHEQNLAWSEALRLYEKVAEQAPEWSRARLKLGWLLNNLARYADAEPHLQAAIEVATDDRERSIAANDLGIHYIHLAQWEKAEEYFRQVIEINKKLYGPDDPEIATTLNNLAQLLQETNRLAEAEPLMRRALAIDEQAFGAGHSKVATDLNNLARLLKTINRLAEAEPLYRRALAIEEGTYGTEHPNVAAHLNNLGQLLQDMNRLTEADTLMRRALAIDESAYGPQHPDVARDLNNLAMLREDANRLAEAEPLIRRALAIDEQSKGAKHPDVAIRLNNLAQILKAMNRFAEAEPLMRRALAIDEQSYGAEHTKVAIRLNNLAALLKAMNRLREAEPLMRRALAIDEHSYRSDHPAVARDLNNLAQLLQDTNRLTEAEPLMRRALTIASMSFVQDHPYLVTFATNYRLLLFEMKMSGDEIERRMTVALETKQPLEPIAPEIELLLGPANPVAEVLAALDEQYKKEGKPAIYFLPADQPIAPHLDELLGPSKLDIPLSEPISPHLDELLGPVEER